MFDDTVAVVVVETLVNGDDVVVDVANHESLKFLLNFSSGFSLENNLNRIKLIRFNQHFNFFKIFEFYLFGILDIL